MRTAALAWSSRWGGALRPAEIHAVVECPDCGEARLEPRDITVRARLENDAWSYRFTCPTCRRPSVASTSRAAALHAVEAGAPLEAWCWAGEMEPRGAGEPALTVVDLLQLSVSLAEPDWLDELS